MFHFDNPVGVHEEYPKVNDAANRAGFPIRLYRTDVIPAGSNDLSICQAAADNNSGNHPDGMNVLPFEGSVQRWDWTVGTEPAGLPGAAGTELGMARN